MRKQILRRELREGDALPPEPELMAQYQISRPTLREALRILEAEGLVQIRRGGIGGAVIQRPDLGLAVQHFALVLQDSEATLGDVHHARTIIEPSALASLAQTATPEQVEELDRLLDETDRLIGHPERYSAAVAALRERIVEMSGAKTVSLLMRLLGELVRTHTAATGGIPADRWARLQKLSQKSHRRLIALIREGDVEGAEDFWRRHLAEVHYHLGHAETQRVFDLLP